MRSLWSIRRRQYSPHLSPFSDRQTVKMVRTPFSLFNTGPVLGVRKPSFLNLPAISTNTSAWLQPSPSPSSYPYNTTATKNNVSRPRYPRRITTAKSVSALETSFSPSNTIESLRNHRWSGMSSWFVWQMLITGFDGQYIFIAIVGIFALSVIEIPGPLIKTLLATLLLIGLVIPITRQFLLPALPVATWGVLFYSARYLLRFPHSNP